MNNFLLKVRNFAIELSVNSPRAKKKRKAYMALWRACEAFIRAFAIVQASKGRGLRRYSQRPPNSKYPEAARWFDDIKESVYSGRIGELFNILATKLPAVGELLLSDWYSGNSLPNNLSPRATLSVPGADPAKHSSIADAVRTGLYLHLPSVRQDGSTDAAGILILNPQRAAKYWRPAKFYESGTRIWPVESLDGVPYDHLALAQGDALSCIKVGCFSLPDSTSSAAFVYTDGRLCIPYVDRPWTTVLKRGKTLKAQHVRAGNVSDVLLVEHTAFPGRFVSAEMLTDDARQKITIGGLQVLVTPCEPRESLPCLCYHTDKIAKDLFPNHRNPESSLDAVLKAREDEMTQILFDDCDLGDWRFYSASQMDQLKDWISHWDTEWLPRDKWLKKMGIAPYSLLEDYPLDSLVNIFKAHDLPCLEPLYAPSSVDQIASKPGYMAFLKTIFPENFLFLERNFLSDFARAAVLADVFAAS